MNYRKDSTLIRYNYSQLPHQRKFITTMDKFPALVAGFGAGKTVAFCLKGLLELGRNPGKIILLAEPTYPMIRDVLRPTMEETLNIIRYQYEYKAQENLFNVKWKNGWGTIIMRSAENWRRWAGLNLAGGGIDEAPTLKDNSAWNMLLSRLRDGTHLSAWTTGTPEGFNWHYNKWEEDAKEGYTLIRGKSYDNPFLPEDYVPTLYDNYDERMIKAYIEGLYVNLQSGTTYYAFERDKNVRQVKWIKELPVHIGMDFNVEPMCAVLWQKYDTSPKVRVIDEIEIHHTGGRELLTDRMAKEIITRYGNRKYICYPDPSGRNRHTSALDSDHDILMQNGFDLRIKRKAPPVTDSVNSVNNAMKFTVIDPKCKGFIKDLEQTTNKNGTREIDKSNKERTHFTDGFRYSIDYEYPVRRPITRTIMA